MKFNERISIQYTNLTSTEKRICTSILDNPKIIINHSIIEAADLCQTSKSAILRFVKKLEYRGYSEFKYAIEVEYNQSPVNYEVRENNSIIHQIADSYCSTINQIAHLGFEDKLSELAKMIDEYKYVMSLAIGNTAFCAQQLVYSLYSHNHFSNYVTDDVQFDFLANCLNKEYLLIIFSVSGSYNTFVNLVKSAKSANAKVILITMNPDTPLLKYCSMNFIIPSTVSPIKNKKVLKQLDNRTILYFFAELISYYYGLYLEEKHSSTN